MNGSIVVIYAFCLRFKVALSADEKTDWESRPQKLVGAYIGEYMSKMRTSTR